MVAADIRQHITGWFTLMECSQMFGIVYIKRSLYRGNLLGILSRSLLQSRLTLYLGNLLKRCWKAKLACLTVIVNRGADS